MTTKQYFVRNFTFHYILKPMESFGDLLRTIPKLTFKTVQKQANNDEYFDRTDEAFQAWLNSQCDKPKIKPLLLSPIHHSELQARSKGGKFSKNNNS